MKQKIINTIMIVINLMRSKGRYTQIEVTKINRTRLQELKIDFRVRSYNEVIKRLLRNFDEMEVKKYGGKKRLSGGRKITLDVE